MKREIPGSWALLLAALVSSCATGSDNREEVARIAAAHERDVRAAEVAAQRLAAEHPVPQSRDLGEEGTLVLHAIDLAGATGRELLRVRFTWLNTTGRDVDAAVVRLFLRDPKSGNEWSEDCVARLPMGLVFAPGSSYTDELRLPTGGVHRREGWSWDIDARVLR